AAVVISAPSDVKEAVEDAVDALGPLRVGEGGLNARRILVVNTTVGQRGHQLGDRLAVGDVANGRETAGVGEAHDLAESVAHEGADARGVTQVGETTKALAEADRHVDRKVAGSCWNRA